MAKISYKLDTRRPLADGKFPLKLVISHRQESAMISTGYSFSVQGWQKALMSIASGKRLSITEEAISNRRTRMEVAMLYMKDTVDISKMSVSELRDRLIRMAADTESRVADDAKDIGKVPYFLDYCRSHMDRLENEGNKGVYKSLISIMGRYEESRGRSLDILLLSDITPDWLRGFNAWMKPTNRESSRSKYLRTIRAVLNAAIDDGIELDYPFSRTSNRGRKRRDNGHGKFVMDPVPPSRKRALKLEKLRLLKDYPCAAHQEKYRDIFMLMVYLIGIRPVDMFTATPEQIVDGRLEYISKKTHEPYSIKIEPEAMAIINKYRGKRLLLAPCETYRDYKDFAHHMNDALKTIGFVYANRQKHTGAALFPELSCYWARHTWTTVAVNYGINEFYAGKGLGHKDCKTRVTDIYLDLDPRIVDATNRKVIDIITGKVDPTDIPVILPLA